MLSNAALHLQLLRGNPSEDRDSIMYHLSAVRSVNRRLANLARENSDGILGAILGVRLQPFFHFLPMMLTRHSSCATM